MKRKALFGCLLILPILLQSFLFGEDIRTPSFKGLYYPSSTPVLLRDVDYFLQTCEKRVILGKIVGLIIPHGKYKTSGLTASYAYKLIKGKRYNTVVIIGPSHHQAFKGVSIYAKDYYYTPLGKVMVNTKLAKRLILENDFITFIPDVHLKEHSIEVQIPFLQRSLKDFKILPILIGEKKEEYFSLLSEALLKVIPRENILLIASANLSHFRSYLDAALRDRETIKILEEFNLKKIASKFKNKKAESCAPYCILTTLLTCKSLGADRVKLLKYTNSGEITGIQWRTVGYASLAIFDLLELDKEKKLWLLRHARRSLEEYLKFKKLQTIVEKDPILNRRYGVYITIKKGKIIRGYLGYILPTKPLYKAVSDGVIKAATKDLKHPPLKKKELKKVKIEISVLSNIEKFKDLELIDMGKHGLYINKDWQEAILLPSEIQKEDSRIDILEKVSRRAGLNKDAWKEEDVELYLFTAQTFSE
jgi:hypothetical protein